MSEESHYETPALMAAAQALAEENGMSINQSYLRDAEQVLAAATCHEGADGNVCCFWKGHKDEHSFELSAKVDRGREALNLLDAIVDAYDLKGPIVDMAKELLHEEPSGP